MTAMPHEIPPPPPAENVPPKIFEDADAPPKLFEDGEVYDVAEIKEKLKCGRDTVIRMAKKNKLRPIRFGKTKYFGRQWNELVERQWQEGKA